MPATEPRAPGRTPPSNRDSRLGRHAKTFEMTSRQTGDMQVHCASVHVAIGAAGLMMCLTCPTSADAQTPSCSPAPPALRLACSDATLEASISALRIAYQIASDDMRGNTTRKAALRRGQKAWMRQVAACGGDSRCIDAAIVDRQREINETRLANGGGHAPSRELIDPPRLVVDAHPEDQTPATPVPAPVIVDDVHRGEAVRGDWPVPPAYAPTVVPGAADASIPARERSVDPGGPDAVRHPTRSGMSPMLLCAALVALGFPLAVFVVLRGEREPRLRGRCPGCRADTLQTEAVTVEGARFARRKGRGRGVSEMTTQRVRHTCPCGYSSDAKSARSAADATRDIRTDTERGNQQT